MRAIEPALSQSKIFFYMFGILILGIFPILLVNWMSRTRVAPYSTRSDSPL